nr:LD-carboxypeptidase [Burkholderiales bacterium]
MEASNDQTLPETLSACLRKHFKSVHLLASSGRVHNPEAMLIGQQRFSAALPVVQTDCADHPVERFAGSDEQRLSQLNSLAMLKEPHLILGIRGGYGVTRLLSSIDFKGIAKAVFESDSLLCAHSDFTALHTALLAHSLRLGQEIPRMLQGPMLCVDFGNDTLDDFMLTAFENALQGSPDNLSWSLPEGCVYNDMTEEGMLWGGNLSMLASLLGTAHLPDVKKGLLFIEDVNEHPYRIERMLLQLLQAGVLQQQQALIVG